MSKLLLLLLILGTYECIYSAIGKATVKAVKSPKARKAAAEKIKKEVKKGAEKIKKMVT